MTASPIKVCQMTSAHGRYDVRIYGKECRSLAKAGFEVHLIVADSKGDEVLNGVHIHDVGKNRTRFDRFFRVTKRVYLKAKELNADIYHFHDPDLMFIGLKLMRQGSSVIYDIHEDVPSDILTKDWVPIFIRKPLSILVDMLERYVSKRMSAVCVPQQLMKEKFRKVNPQAELIANYVIFDPTVQFTKKTGLNTKHLFHAGSLSKERGLFNMLDAMLSVSQGVKLYLAGNFLDKATEEQAFIHPAWNRVSYLGIISPQEVVDYYQQCSIGIILYNNVGQYWMAGAVKSFEYMLNEMPFLMPDFGEWITFNAKNNCGINVNVTDGKNVADAINLLIEDDELRQNIGSSSREIAIKKFTWANEAAKLISLYEKILEDK